MRICIRVVQVLALIFCGFSAGLWAQDTPTRSGVITSIDVTNGTVCIDGPVISLVGVDIVLLDESTVTAAAAIQADRLKRGTRVAIDLQPNTQDLIAVRVRVLSETEEAEGGPNTIVGLVGAADATELELQELCFAVIGSSDLSEDGEEISIESLAIGDVISVQVGSVPAGRVRPQATQVTVTAEAPGPREGQVTSVDRANGFIYVEGVTFRVPRGSVRIGTDEDNDVAFETAVSSGLLKSGVRIAVDLAADSTALVATGIRILGAEEAVEAGPARLVGTIDMINTATNEVELNEVRFPLSQDVTIVEGDDTVALDDLDPGDVVKIRVSTPVAGGVRPRAEEIVVVSSGPAPRVGQVVRIDTDNNLVCIGDVTIHFALDVPVVQADGTSLTITAADQQGVVDQGVRVAIDLKATPDSLIASRIRVLAEGEAGGAGVLTIVGDIDNVSMDILEIEMAELCFPFVTNVVIGEDGQGLAVSDLRVGDLIEVFVSNPDSTGLGVRPPVAQIERVSGVVPRIGRITSFEDPATRVDDDDDSDGNSSEDGGPGTDPNDPDDPATDPNAPNTGSDDPDEEGMFICIDGVTVNVSDPNLLVRRLDAMFVPIAQAGLKAGTRVSIALKVGTKDLMATRMSILEPGPPGFAHATRLVGTIHSLNLAVGEIEMAELCFPVEDETVVHDEDGTSLGVSDLDVGDLVAVFVGSSTPDGSRPLATLVIRTGRNAGELPADPVMAADIDGDGEVGFSDFTSLAQAFGKEFSDPDFNPKTDLNGDGRISFFDFVIFAQSFGKKVGGKPAFKAVVPANTGRVLIESQTKNDQLNVDVRIEGVENVLTYALDFAYNSDVLEFVGSRSLMSSRFTNTTGAVVLQQISEPGKLMLADALVDYAEGDLVRLTFKVLVPNTPAEISIVDARIADLHGQISVLAGDVMRTLPSAYKLAQNFPNPFNPETVVPFDLPESGEVHLAIYNALGQEIRVLADGVKDAGYYRLVWDGRDALGKSVSSGIYFVRLQAGSFGAVQKMLLLK